MLSAVVLAVAALTVAGGGDANGAAGRGLVDDDDDTTEPSAPIPATAACPHDEEPLMFPYDSVLDPGVPGGDDYLKITLESSVQLAGRDARGELADRTVAKFVRKLTREGTSPIWASFTAAKFDTTFVSSSQTFTVDEVKYPTKKSAILLFTVEVDTYASQVPQVRASAQVAGRLVCEGGFWHVALADVCSILGRGTGPPCPAKVKKKAKAALPRALKRADLPEVTDPTVVTVPTTTSPPTTFAPAPAPNFDGFCPYVGQPCSANVTNDPDCTCVPTSGVSFGSFFADGVCRLRGDTTPA